MSLTWMEIQRFRSRRNGTLYAVKLSSRGEIGCNCPGWTKRVRVQEGMLVRSCKHTRWVNEHLRQANGLYVASDEIVEI